MTICRCRPKGRDRKDHHGSLRLRLQYRAVPIYLAGPEGHQAQEQRYRRLSISPSMSMTSRRLRPISKARAWRPAWGRSRSSQGPAAGQTIYVFPGALGSAVGSDQLSQGHGLREDLADQVVVAQRSGTVTRSFCLWPGRGREALSLRVMSRPSTFQSPAGGGCPGSHQFGMAGLVPAIRIFAVRVFLVGTRQTAVSGHVCGKKCRKMTFHPRSSTMALRPSGMSPKPLISGRSTCRHHITSRDFRPGPGSHSYTQRA